MTDHIRSESARRRRENEAELEMDQLAPPVDAARASDQDETLILLFMCCHPALTPAAAIALTLRAVGGLTTAEIAHGFLVPEPTMAQRVSRAKQSIRTPAFTARRRGCSCWMRSKTMRELGLCSNADTAISLTDTFSYKIDQPQKQQP